MDLVQMCNLRKGTKWLYSIVTVVTIVFSQHGQRMFGAVHLSEHIVRSTTLERWSSSDNVPFDAHGAKGFRPSIAPTSSGTLWQQAVAPGTGQVVVIADLAGKVGGSDVATAKVRCDGRRPDLGHAHDQYRRGQLEVGGQ